MKLLGSIILYQSSLSKRDFFLRFFLGFNGFFSSLCVALIFLFLLRESLVVLSSGNFSQFITDSWYPLEGKFNLVPILVGSLCLAFGSIVLAVPLGLFCSFFVSSYAPKTLAVFLKRVMELYTGIPSVIFGFWGMMTIVPFLSKYNPPGHSLFAGILILTLMIFPLVSLNMIAATELHGPRLSKVAESLGLRKSTYLWKILLPKIRSQVLGGSLLALGRAVGETMAVLMVCGNIVQVPDSFFAPIRALTSNIALEMAYATGSHRSALFLTGFLLLLMVSVLFLFSDIFKRRWDNG